MHVAAAEYSQCPSPHLPGLTACSPAPMSGFSRAYVPLRLISLLLDPSPSSLVLESLWGGTCGSGWAVGDSELRWVGGGERGAPGRGTSSASVVTHTPVCHDPFPSRLCLGGGGEATGLLVQGALGFLGARALVGPRSSGSWRQGWNCQATPTSQPQLRVLRPQPRL